MKILFLGDIVGREARKTVLSELLKLKNKYKADIIIINIENAAGGRGVTPKIAEQFLMLELIFLRLEIMFGIKERL